MDKEFSRIKYTSGKKILILVLGDHGSGKSTFLKTYCDEMTAKMKKNFLGMNIFLKRQTLSTKIIIDKGVAYEKYIIEFLELCGEKIYKDAMAFYVKELMNEIKAIFYFYDLSNIKSMFNFYMWVKFLLEIEGIDNKNNPIWKKPFFVVGLKMNLLCPNEKKDKIEQSLHYFKGLFACPDGENLLFLMQKNISQYDISVNILDLFINQLCVKEELFIHKEKSFDMEGEYVIDLELALNVKNPDNYLLRKEVILNNLFFKTAAKETFGNLLYEIFMKYFYKNINIMVKSIQKAC